MKIQEMNKDKKGGTAHDGSGKAISTGEVKMKKRLNKGKALTNQRVVTYKIKNDMLISVGQGNL